MIFFSLNGKADAEQILLHGFIRLAVLLCILLFTGCMKQNINGFRSKAQLVNSDVMSPFMEALDRYDGLAQ